MLFQSLSKDANYKFFGCYLCTMSYININASCKDGSYDHLYIYLIACIDIMLQRILVTDLFSLHEKERIKKSIFNSTNVHSKQGKQLF